MKSPKKFRKNVVSEAIILDEIEETKKDLENLNYKPKMKHLPSSNSVDGKKLQSFMYKFGLSSALAMLYSFRGSVFETIVALINYPLKFVNWNALVYPFLSLRYINKHFKSLFSKDVASSVVFAFDNFRADSPGVLNFFGNSKHLAKSVFKELCVLTGCDAKRNVFDLANLQTEEFYERIVSKVPTVFFLENLDKVNEIETLKKLHSATDEFLKGQPHHMFVIHSQSKQKVIESMDNIFKGEYYSDFTARYFSPDTFVKDIPLDATLVSETTLFSHFKQLTIEWYQTTTDYLYSIVNNRNVAILLGSAAALYILYRMFGIWNKKTKQKSL